MPGALLPPASPIPGGITGGPTGTTSGGGIGAAAGASGVNPTQPITPTFYGSQQTNNQGGAGAQTNAGTQLNQYTAGQQALQGQIPQLLQGLLSGTSTIPPYWTAPPQVFDAYNTQFQNKMAPQYAAQYGAGGPQGLSAQAQGNQQLAASLYQGGIQNFQNLLGMGQSTAFGAPVGQQTAQTGVNNWQQQGNQDQKGYETGNPLGALGLGGAAAGSVLSQLTNLLGLGG